MHQQTAFLHTYRRKNSTAGFTLMELIVVLVILGILFSTGAIGWANWHKNSMYRKNNEYAQSLFAAAQSSLTHYKASGQLEELKKQLEEGSIPGSGRVPGSIAARGLTENAGETKERELYYLDFTKEDYEAYKAADFEDEESMNNPLFWLLKDYVHDSGIFDAAIRVEFDPEDGNVLAVCYSDRVKKFDYSTADGYDGEIMGVGNENREEARRKDILLGYYESGLSAAIPDEFAAPEISKVALVNGETLHAEITLKKNSRPFARSYAYQIEVYSKATDAMLFSFTLNESYQGAFNQPAMMTGNSETKVTFADGSEQMMNIGSFLNDEGAICVVLDGADLAAAEKCDEYLKNYASLDVQGLELENTYSALRFPLQVNDKIYVKAKAKSVSKTSEEMQSNDEFVMMGTGSDLSANKLVVANARHLFNLRFYGDYQNLERPWQFVQMGDISWGGADGIVAHGFLYDSRTAAGTVVAAGERNRAVFWPINQLGEKHSYTAKGSGTSEPFAIRYLTLLEKGMPEAAGAAVGKENVYATGLFRVNHGKIQDLTFVSPAVQGVDFVGTLCGQNRGTIGNIAVEKDEAAEDGDRDYVCGREFVGGVAGGMLPGAGAAEETTGLRSRMHVYGRAFVGGITGYHKRSSAAKMSDCHNTGLVEVKNIVIDGSELAASPDAYRYIGGIAGYFGGGSLENCTSVSGSETYQDLQIVSQLTEADFLGDYVGGIVGAATQAEIVNCSTVGADGSMEAAAGILTGRKCVGGVAGFLNNGTLDGTQADGSQGVNRVVTVAWQSAGGIVGNNCNGVSQAVGTVGKWNGMEAVRPGTGALPGAAAEAPAAWDTSACIGTVKNWANEAMVLSSHQFSGGIAGWNTGILDGCSSRIAVSEAEQMALLKQVMAAETAGNPSGYIGGLAGYNNGSITTAKADTLTPVLAGHHYVGGLVGYNDKNGLVGGSDNTLPVGSQYSVIGGVLEADVAAGGLAGLNRSAGMLADSAQQARLQAQIAPELVNATWCAGGLFGANLLDGAVEKYLPYRESAQTVTSFKNDGVSAAGGFTGGLIGYHGMNVDNSGVLLSIAKLQGTVSAEEAIRTMVAEAAALTVPQGKLIVTGQEEQAQKAAEEIPVEAVTGKVAGGTFVGGCIGYQSKENALLLQNIPASRSVVGSSPQPVVTAGTADLAGFSILKDAAASSFTGGLLSIAGRNTEIRDCSLQAAVYAPNSDYVGGVAAFHLGNMENTAMYGSVGTAGNYGAEAASAGGLAGWNGGSIVASTLESGACVVASDMVGGIAAENYGTIRNSGDGYQTLSGSVESGGSASCMGNVAAFSEAGAAIEGYRVTAEGQMNGGAEKTGGIVGWNRGSIGNCRNDRNLCLSGNYIGGIAGFVDNVDAIQIGKCINTGTIPGGASRAGIVAAKEKEGILTIERCHNYGRVQDEEDLRGILASYDGAGVLNLVDCFGISDIRYPLTDLEAGGNVNISDCYYFDYTRKHNEEKLTTYINGPVDEGEENSLKRLMDGNTYEPYVSSLKKGIYKFSFSKPEVLSGFEVDWTGKEPYEWELRVADSDDTWKKVEEGSGGSGEERFTFAEISDVKKAELTFISADKIAISEIAFDNGAVLAKEPGKDLGSGIPLITAYDGQIAVKSRHPETKMIDYLPASPYGWNDTMSALCDELDRFLIINPDPEPDERCQMPEALHAEADEERIYFRWENTEEQEPFGYLVRMELYRDSEDDDAVETLYFKLHKGTYLDIAILEQWREAQARLWVKKLDYAKEELDSEWAGFVELTIPGEREKLETPKLSLWDWFESVTFANEDGTEERSRTAEYQEISWDAVEGAKAYELVLTSVDGTSQTVSIVPDETGSFAADSLNWGYEAQIRTDDSMDTAEMAAGLSAQLTAEFTFDQSDNSFCLRLPDARFSTDDGADGYTAEAVYWNTASVTVRAIGTKDGAEITSDRAQWILLEYGVEGSNSFEGKNENGLNLRSLADGESWSSAVSNADYFVVKRAEAPIRITAYTPGLLLEMPEEETEEWES